MTKILYINTGRKVQEIFMDSNWVTHLDALAAGGVIDFDAPAFLLDQPPRYIGHPDMEQLPMQTPMLLPEGIKLKDVPDTDLLDISKDKNLVHNPTWKKVLFCGLIALGTIFGGLNIFKKFKKP